MCPCLSSKSEYATCSKAKDELRSPSLYERENYCLDLYELCPLFYKTLAGIEETSDSDSLNLINA
jgi:hypothetical protein